MLLAVKTGLARTESAFVESALHLPLAGRQALA
jgi:hypothetical protein